MTAQVEVILRSSKGEAGTQQGPFGRLSEALSRDQECNMYVKSLPSLPLGNKESSLSGPCIPGLES